MKKRLKLGLNLFNPHIWPAVWVSQQWQAELRQCGVRMSDIKLFARITISHLLLRDVTILQTRDLGAIMKWRPGYDCYDWCWLGVWWPVSVCDVHVTWCWHLTMPLTQIPPIDGGGGHHSHIPLSKPGVRPNIILNTPMDTNYGLTTILYDFLGLDS